MKFKKEKALTIEEKRQLVIELYKHDRGKIKRTKKRKN
jgi:hypothetical protein